MTEQFRRIWLKDFCSVNLGSLEIFTIYTHKTLGITAYQPNVGLMSTYLQTQVNDHLASLGVKCDYHILQSSLALSAGITATNQWLTKSLTILWWHRPYIIIENSFPTEVWTSNASHSKSSKQHTLNCMTTGD